MKAKKKSGKKKPPSGRDGKIVVHSRVDEAIGNRFKDYAAGRKTAVTELLERAMELLMKTQPSDGKVKWVPPNKPKKGSKPKAKKKSAAAPNVKKTKTKVVVPNDQLPGMRDADATPKAGNGRKAKAGGKVPPARKQPIKPKKPAKV